MGDHSGHMMGHQMSPSTTGSPPIASPAASMSHGGHAGHSMSMDGSNSMNHMMKMYFHFDLGDIVLFENWVLQTCWSTFGSCVAFFILAIAYEGLKCYREHMLKRWSFKQRAQISIIGSNGISSSGNGNGHDSPSHQRLAGGGGDVDMRQPRNSATGKMFSKAHLVQSVLHILQVAVSYTLMLGFMTFNGWLCISILGGAGFGYFVFCWRKLSVVDVTEHCH